jgi:activator of HSP90 ATPase
MLESVVLDMWFPVEPKVFFKAWLDSRAHGAFTGSAASIEPRVGGAFTAWDGYIRGKTLELDPPRRILQAWRTSDFPDGAPDSLLELQLDPISGGTQLTLRHTGIPEAQGVDYAQGWLDYYFEPMQTYFRSRR